MTYAALTENLDKNEKRKFDLALYKDVPKRTRGDRRVVAPAAPTAIEMGGLMAVFGMPVAP